MQESGYPTFDVSSWFGVIAPKGTPDEVVNKLNATILAALAKPDVQKRLADLGAVPAKTTPAEFGTFISPKSTTGPRWSSLPAPQWTRMTLSTHDGRPDRKRTSLNYRHYYASRMPSSA